MNGVIYVLASLVQLLVLGWILYQSLNGMLFLFSKVHAISSPKEVAREYRKRAVKAAICIMLLMTIKYFTA